MTNHSSLPLSEFYHRHHHQVCDFEADGADKVGDKLDNEGNSMHPCRNLKLTLGYENAQIEKNTQKDAY